MLELFLKENRVEAGCDEAGRGCLAGPVFAAAVILPNNFKCNLLDDSKKLSKPKREKLREIIIKESISWAIGVVSQQEIDKINILNSSFLAMHRAIDDLKVIPEYLLIDGNRFKKYKHLPHECIIKGDGKYMSIAAASILAKTYRDDYMEKLHIDFPNYKWNKNAGYPTKEHRLAIKKFGVTEHHRKSFNLLPSRQLSLFD